jgi:hypothetical protein
MPPRAPEGTTPMDLACTLYLLALPRLLITLGVVLPAGWSTRPPASSPSSATAPPAGDDVARPVTTSPLR